jgi:periplasmic copper chaperone A
MPRGFDLGIVTLRGECPPMHRILIEIIAAVALTAAAIIASVSAVSAADVMVVEAFARASATPTAKAAAAYVTVMNHGGEPDRLLSVSTPAAEAAELHQSVEENGVMKMPSLESAELPAMGTLEMKPGGVHVMLMGLKAPLKEGESIVITLTFEKAGKLDVTVPVGGVAASGHDHGHSDTGSSSGG